MNTTLTINYLSHLPEHHLNDDLADTDVIERFVLLSTGKFSTQQTFHTVSVYKINFKTKNRNPHVDEV